MWRLRVPARYVDGVPHATGVAALIISRIGTESVLPGADPTAVETALRGTATDAMTSSRRWILQDWRTFCPVPPTPFHYDDPALVDPLVSFDALCEGDANPNGFYGDGVVNALAAANLPRVVRRDRPGQGPGRSRVSALERSRRVQDLLDLGLSVLGPEVHSS